MPLRWASRMQPKFRPSARRYLCPKWSEPALPASLPACIPCATCGRAQVDDLHAQLAEVDARNQHGGSGVDALMHELHQTQDTNAQLAAELDGVRAEVDQRVERSAQFVNMRQARAHAGLPRPCITVCVPRWRPALAWRVADACQEE